MASDRLLLSNEKLTLHDMAMRLGVSTDVVLHKTERGDLFSFARVRRPDERLYPIYQLAPEIRLDVLSRAREALSDDGPLLHSYFTARDPDMADLTVREVLAGQAIAGFAPDDDACWLLAQPVSLRLLAVAAALERFSAVVQDWP